MSLRRYSSIASETTLSAGISSTSTSLDVVNGFGYPDPPFIIKIENEAILVGAKSGNTFSSLGRGIDGTTAVTHAPGKPVTHAVIGDDLDYRWLDRQVSRDWGTYDDEFGDASIDPLWVPIDPSGSTTWTEKYGVMSVKGGGQSAEDVAALVKPLPVLPPWSVESAVRILAPLESYTMAGIVLSDGATSGSNAVTTWAYISSTNGSISVQRRSGTFLSMASNVASKNIQRVGPWLHIRLNWTAINSFTAEYSPDGVSWLDFGWSPISLTFSPTHAGLCMSSWGASSDRVVTWDYYRTYEM